MQQRAEMTGRPSPQGDAAEILERVRSVAAEAQRRAEEIDAERRMPLDLWAKLEATGVFWSLVPKAHGGLELPLAFALEAIIVGARANGSLGWLMMISSTMGLVIGLLPVDELREMLKDGRLPRARGSIAPKGIAIPTAGGYRVAGQWPFASGGADPDYVSGMCVVFEDGKPRIGPHGPEVVAARILRSDVEPLDTWHVLGMRGTDSRDYAARDVFVPLERCDTFFTAKNNFGTAEARLPVRVLLSTAHCAVAIGIAEGALDDIMALAKTKRPSMNPSAPMTENAVFRHALGEHTLRLSACRAMLDQVAKDALETAETGYSPSPRQIMAGKAMSTFVTAECVKIVDWVYTAAGSASVYDVSPIQRRFRDIHVAKQHAACHSDLYGLLGAALMGAELSPVDLS